MALGRLLLLFCLCAATWRQATGLGCGGAARAAAARPRLGAAAGADSGPGVDSLWAAGLEPGRGGDEGATRVKRAPLPPTSVAAAEDDVVAAAAATATATAASGLLAANPNADDLYVEYGMIDETLIDRSIEKAVQQIIEEGLGGGDKKAPEPTPVEKFQQMYLDIKARKKGQTQTQPAPGSPALDAAVMLEALLGGEQAKDPFDERKVMMKLRTMLDTQDFSDLFKDPTIGDWL